MKKLITLSMGLAIILIVPPAFCWTYSNVAPRIQRLQGVILFPTDITVEAVDRAGTPETQYKYRLIRIQDAGQKIHQDRAKWVDENKDLLDAELYGSMSDVIEKIATDKSIDLQAEAACKLTEMKKAIPKVAEKEIPK